jgi:hypothetical protein
MTIGLDGLMAAPVLLVDEEIHDFGSLYAEDHPTVTHQYMLQNAGDETLVIGEVETSCGCTRAEMSRKEVPPGETATLDAELRFRDRHGVETIRITIHSDDPSRPSLDLGLKGFIFRHWEVDPPEIKELVMPSSATETKTLTVVSNQMLGEEPWRILSATSDHPSVKVRLVSGQTPDERNNYRKSSKVYEVAICSGADASRKEEADVFFATTDSANKQVKTHLTWIVEKDLTIQPRRAGLLLSRFHRQTTGRGQAEGFGRKDRKKFAIHSKSKTPFRILEAKVTKPFLVSWSPGIEASSAEVVVSITGEAAARMDGTLAITTDRPGENLFEILIKGEVQQQSPIIASSAFHYHFGTLFEDEAGEIHQTFDVGNSGNKDLHVSLGALNGLEGSFSQEVLPPGVTATLSVRGNLKGLIGAVDLSAEIESNDPASPQTIFHLSGTVLPKWQLLPSRVQFKSVQPKTEELRKTKITQHFPSWEKPAILPRTQTEDGEIAIEAGNQKVVYDPVGYGTAETELTVHLNTTRLPGHWSREVQLATPPGIEHSPPPLTVEWDIPGDIRSRPASLLIELPSEGNGQAKPVRLKVFSREKRAFTVGDITAPSGISLKEVGHDPSEVTYEVTASVPVAEEAQLIFNTDRPDEPQLAVEVVTRKR